MADFYTVPKVHKESIEKAMNLSPQPLANFWSNFFFMLAALNKARKYFQQRSKSALLDFHLQSLFLSSSIQTITVWSGNEVCMLNQSSNSQHHRIPSLYARFSSDIQMLCCIMLDKMVFIFCDFRYLEVRCHVKASLSGLSAISREKKRYFREQFILPLASQHHQCQKRYNALLEELQPGISNSTPKRTPILYF